MARRLSATSRKTSPSSWRTLKFESHLPVIRCDRLVTEKMPAHHCSQSPYLQAFVADQMLCVGTACCAGATLEGPGEEAFRVHRLPHRAVRGEVQGEGGDRHFEAQPLPEVTSRDALPNITRSPQARGFAPAHEPGALPRTPRRKRRRRRTRKRVPAGGGGRGSKAGTGSEVAGSASLV